MARAAAISAPDLHQIEAGKRRPSTNVLRHLANALNIPFDMLLIA
jgi:transcriptional regulator with XRE-family HTH domain